MKSWALTGCNLLPSVMIAIALSSAQRLLAQTASELASSKDATAAVTRSLPLLQKAAANYPKHRDCFSCHHQTLPMLAMTTARAHRLAVDDRVLEAQAQFTHKWFEAQIGNMKQGRGIGGRAMNVGYGLWALSLADWKADATTQAMVTYLLKTQKPDGHWEGQVSRPPLEESYVMATALACAGMKKYATASQKSQLDAAAAKAGSWLGGAPLKGQEDKTAKLWGLHVLGDSQDEIRKARAGVLAAQHEDGGWSQTVEMKSDAYATGQALFVLQATGLASSDAAYERGIQYLVKTQAKDGSWYVKTRSRPIQTYFDNGDPYGNDQFISICATAWASAALAQSLDFRAPAE